MTKPSLQDQADAVQYEIEVCNDSWRTYPTRRIVPPTPEDGYQLRALKAALATLRELLKRGRK